MSYPERRGRSLGHAAQGAFVVIAILFAAGMFGVGVYVGQNSEPHTEETAAVAGGTGGDSDTETTAGVGESEEETDEESEGEAGGDDGESEGDDTGGEETTGETETEGEETVAEDEQDVSGEEIFAAAGCANCHNLDEAGAEGSVGPDLDETSLDRDGIEEIIRNGRGAMPAFEGNLQDDQIEAVADYVAESVG